MKTYPDSNRRGQPTRTAEEALPELLADLDALRGLFMGSIIRVAIGDRRNVATACIKTSTG